MKILHIVPAYHPEGPGGIEVYSRDLVQSQRAAGHAVEVLTGCCEVWEQPGIDRYEVDGATVHRLHRDDLYFEHHGKSYHPGVSQLVEELLGRLQPDIVHVHHWLRITSDLVAIAAAQGVPAVVTLHDFYTSCPRCYRFDRQGEPCERPLSLENCRGCAPRFAHESPREVDLAIELFAEQYRAELDGAAAVLAANRATATYLERLSGFPADRVVELPLGYRRRFDPGSTGAPPNRAPGGPLRIGCWGRIGRHKGVDHILRALRLARDRMAPTDWSLHLFGEIDSAPLEAELRALAEGLPVEFHGAFEPRDLSAANLDAAVFASRAIETHGLVLDEAWELGLAVIVAARGPLADRARGRAHCVDPHSLEELAEALTRLVLEPPASSPPAALPPTPSEHLVALLEVYGRAIDSGARSTDLARPSATRRAVLAHLQRESAQAAAIDGPPD